MDNRLHALYLVAACATKLTLAPRPNFKRIALGHDRVGDDDVFTTAIGHLDHLLFAALVAPSKVRVLVCGA